MKREFQQKVQEKEQKLKQSEEELYARHREMKEALEKQRLELEDKKRRVESGRPLTPEKGSVSHSESSFSAFFWRGTFSLTTSSLDLAEKTVRSRQMIQSHTLFGLILKLR